MVMHNSVHMAKVTWNFILPKYTQNKCQIKSEISTLLRRQIKMQRKYSVLQYMATQLHNSTV